MARNKCIIIIIIIFNCTVIDWQKVSLVSLLYKPCIHLFTYQSNISDTTIPHLGVTEGIGVEGALTSWPTGFMRASVGDTPALEQSTWPSGEQLGSTPDKIMSSLRSDRDVVCRQIPHWNDWPQQHNKQNTSVNSHRHISIQSRHTSECRTGSCPIKQTHWTRSSATLAGAPEAYTNWLWQI